MTRMETAVRVYAMPKARGHFIRFPAKRCAPLGDTLPKNQGLAPIKNLHFPLYTRLRSARVARELKTEVPAQRSTQNNSPAAAVVAAR